MATTTTETMLLRADVLRRPGWTLRRMRQFLREADGVRAVGGRLINVYRLSHVEAIERTAEFRAAAAS